MPQDSRRPVIQDIRPLTPEERTWRRTATKRVRRFRFYLVLAIVTSVVLAASLLVGYWIGRQP